MKVILENFYLTKLIMQKRILFIYLFFSLNWQNKGRRDSYY